MGRIQIADLSDLPPRGRRWPQRARQARREDFRRRHLNWRLRPRLMGVAGPVYLTGGGIPVVGGRALGAPPAPVGTQLLAYIKASVGTRVLSGQMLGVFSTNPTFALRNDLLFNGSNAAQLTIGAPGYSTNTGLMPAIIATYCVPGATSANCYVNAALNASPNDSNTISIAINLQTPALLDLIFIPTNPAGVGNNPYASGNSVLSGGSACQNQYYTEVDNFCDAVLSKLTHAYLFSPPGELGLTGGLGITGSSGGFNWWATNAAGSGVPSSSQVQQLWVNTFERITVTNGCRGMLWNFEINSFTDYSFGFPGSTYCDLVSYDTDPALPIDTSAYAWMQSTGLPMWYSSYQDSSGNVGTNAGNNNYTSLQSGLLTPYSEFWGYAIWSDNGGGLNNQPGAVAAMSTNPFTYAAKLPAFTSAGGVAGNWSFSMALDVAFGLAAANGTGNQAAVTATVPATDLCLLMLVVPNGGTVTSKSTSKLDAFGNAGNPIASFIDSNGSNVSLYIISSLVGGSTTFTFNLSGAGTWLILGAALSGRQGTWRLSIGTAISEAFDQPQTIAALASAAGAGDDLLAIFTDLFGTTNPESWSTFTGGYTQVGPSGQVTGNGGSGGGPAGSMAFQGSVAGGATYGGTYETGQFVLQGGFTIALPAAVNNAAAVAWVA